MDLADILCDGVLWIYWTLHTIQWWAFVYSELFELFFKEKLCVVTYIEGQNEKFSNTRSNCCEMVVPVQRYVSFQVLFGFAILSERPVIPGSLSHFCWSLRRPWLAKAPFICSFSPLLSKILVLPD